MDGRHAGRGGERRLAALGLARERAAQTPGEPDDVGATGVCRSDWHAWRGHDPVPLPHTPGHEWAGTIAEVGGSVTGHPDVGPDQRGHVLARFQRAEERDPAEPRVQAQLDRRSLDLAVRIRANRLGAPECSFRVDATFNGF